MTSWQFTFNFFIAIGIIALIVGAVLAYRKWGPNWAAIAGRMPEFDGAVFTVILGAALLVLALWLAGTPVLFDGLWWLVTIFIIGALAFFAIKLIEGNWRWVTGITTIALALIILAATHTTFEVSGPDTDTADTAAPAGGTTKVVVHGGECPNFSPKRLTLGREWVAVNPDHPDAQCDFVYVVMKGLIEKGGPDGNEIGRKGTTGRVSSRVITKVRAVSTKDNGPHAVVLYTLCPPGKAPKDDSSVCRV